MIEIYRDFELVTMTPAFERLSWMRRMAAPDEVLLVTTFAPEKLEYFARGNVLYKRNTHSAAFVEGVSIAQNMDGVPMLTVRGRGAFSLLDRRVITLTGAHPLNAAINRIINDNFLTGAPAARRMNPLLRLLPHNLPDVLIEADYTNTDALSAISQMLVQHTAGGRIRCNHHTQTLDAEFYLPCASDAVFSADFVNVLDWDYSESCENYKNTVLVDGTWHGSHTGPARREMFARAANNTAGARSRAAATALRNNRVQRELGVVINPHSPQFEYLADYDLGSIVQVWHRDWNVRSTDVITSVLEFIDAAGLHLEIGLREYGG